MGFNRRGFLNTALAGFSGWILGKDFETKNGSGKIPRADLKANLRGKRSHNETVRVATITPEGVNLNSNGEVISPEQVREVTVANQRRQELKEQIEDLEQKQNANEEEQERLQQDGKRMRRYLAMAGLGLAVLASLYPDSSASPAPAKETRWKVFNLVEQGKLTRAQLRELLGKVSLIEDVTPTDGSSPYPRVLKLTFNGTEETLMVACSRSDKHLTGNQFHFSIGPNLLTKQERSLLILTALPTRSLPTDLAQEHRALFSKLLMDKEVSVPWAEIVPFGSKPQQSQEEPIILIPSNDSDTVDAFDDSDTDHTFDDSDTDFLPWNDIIGEGAEFPVSDQSEGGNNRVTISDPPAPIVVEPLEAQEPVDDLREQIGDFVNKSIGEYDDEDRRQTLYTGDQFQPFVNAILKVVLREIKGDPNHFLSNFDFDDLQIDSDIFFRDNSKDLYKDLATNPEGANNYDIARLFFGDDEILGIAGIIKQTIIDKVYLRDKFNPLNVMREPVRDQGLNITEYPTLANLKEAYLDQVIKLDDSLWYDQDEVKRAPLD